MHAGCAAQIWGLPHSPEVNLKACVVLADAGGGVWEVDVGGTRHTVATAHLRVTATRYLGPWLGGDDAVARAWDTRVVSRMADRLDALRTAGMPQAVYGRVLLQKVLLFGQAVFFCTNQYPAGMPAMVRTWQSQMSDVLWSTSLGDERAAAGSDRGRPPALVRLPTAAQDHADGGCVVLQL